MIYCVWYPSGGFGHFINAVLSLYGTNFARPNATAVKFNNDGNSHALDLIAPKYSKNLNNYNFNFLPNYNYSVLIDNGINDEGTEFLKIFPDSVVIKLCYSDMSWPIVSKTMIEKAMRSSVIQEMPLGDWPTTEPWAVREKYFLYLRDHQLRHMWEPTKTAVPVLIENMLDYHVLKSTLELAGVVLEDFTELWQAWYTKNIQYFTPVLRSQSIITSLKNNINQDLSDITDIWEQAVIYYFIWVEFNQEVPHNDFANFFKNTNEIKQWLTL